MTDSPPIPLSEQIAAVSENVEILEAQLIGFGPTHLRDRPNVRKQLAAMKAVLVTLRERDDDAR